MGEQIQLTFTLSGSGGGSDFRPPSFNDFLTLSGPNRSDNMQIINGSVSSSVSYGYILQPRAEGKFTIGPASIKYNGRELRSQPILIEVTKGAPPSKQGQKQADNTDIGKQIGDNLFLKVTVDKPRLYQGEQLTATYKIYTRIAVMNYGITKVPSLTGFWSEDLEVPKQLQLTTEVVGGKQYRVGILKKVALFPQRSGSLSIDPMETECVVQVQTKRRSNDFFDQFFNDPFFGNVQQVKYKVQSEPMKVAVLPLPSSGVPKGFAGAVGKFSMEAWLDKRQTKANEPVTLRVKISGTGNLKLLEAPALNVPPDLEKYDPKISDNVTKQGDRISGSRTFEYLLIPRHPGDQKIPPFQFAYFDIEGKSYVSLSSPEFLLTVEKGTENATAAASGISKEDVKLLGEDIRFIKSGQVQLRRRGEIFPGSFVFYAASIFPVVAFFGFFFYLKRREKVMGNAVMLRNRRARKVVRQRLIEAKKFLDGKKREEFYAEASRALWGYIGDKLGIPPADLSTEAVKTSLDGRGIAAETVSKLLSTIENCEYARFAPSSDAGQMETVYNEAAALISSIEDQLR